MTTLNQELYEALKEVGASEGTAMRAAASIYDKEQIATKLDIAELRTEMAEIKGALTLVQWMLGFNLALSLAMALAAIGPYLAKLFRP
jgi:hypothetical protein